jgi:hypothetical protein
VGILLGKSYINKIVISVVMESSFEWDESKNQANLEKNGVSFELAQYAFFDPHRIILDDI